jgi:hypothetical protein
MSNITLFQQELPDYLKEVELDDMTKALAGGGGSKRISIRGSVFRLVVNGEEIAKNESRSMNVVIVNGSRKVGRTFYAGVYDPKNPAPPDCWSSDGEKPDASIEDPQHKSCAECPQNIKGSGQGGGRACRFKQRLAVVLEGDVNGDVYGIELAATSIFGNSTDLNKMPFQQYAKYVGAQGKNINTLVTEMRLDSDSDTPKLTFKPIRFLSREEWQASVAQGDTPEAKAAATLSFPKREEKDEPFETPKVETKPVEAEEEEPKKRASKKQEPAAKKDISSIMNNWMTDDE